MSYSSPTQHAVSRPQPLLTTLRDAMEACIYPEDTGHWVGLGLVLVQPRTRWTSAKPALIRRLVSAG